MKRDDLITLAFGGTKIRALECVFADALAKGADTVITICSLNGNQSIEVAAAARKLGMQVVIIARDPAGYYPPHVYDSNLLLKRIIGARIEAVVGERTSERGHNLATRRGERIAEDLRESGHKPYIIDYNSPIWAAGAANLIPELVSQAEKEGIKFDSLVHTSSTGGTQSGLVLAAKVLDTKMRVIGISNGYEAKSLVAQRIAAISNATAGLLGLDFSASPNNIIYLDDYVGAGYGVIDEDALQAVRLLSETEGIFIDPQYNARGMLGLIDLIRKGCFKRGDNVVFIHSGGMPILFSYREPISDMLESRRPSWTRPPWER
jgi:L-cysteate sulfo-lyase